MDPTDELYLLVHLHGMFQPNHSPRPNKSLLDWDITFWSGGARVGEAWLDFSIFPRDRLLDKPDQM